MARRDSEYYEPYANFARTLRAWFIAFGIGVPALIVSQEHLLNKVLQSGSSHRIAGLFLGGVALQVGEALLYKYVMWQLYMGELDGVYKETVWYRAADAVSVATIAEAVIDLATVAFFAAAMYSVLQVLA